MEDKGNNYVAVPAGMMWTVQGTNNCTCKNDVTGERLAVPAGMM